MTRIKCRGQQIGIESLEQEVLGRLLAVPWHRTFLVYTPFIWIKRFLLG